MKIENGMNMLVFNCGSSSLTFKVFSPAAGGNVKTVLTGKAHRVGVKGTQPSYIEYQYGPDTERSEVPLPSHEAAAALTGAPFKTAADLKTYAP